MGETKTRLISGFSIGIIYIFCFNLDHYIFVYHIFFLMLTLFIQIFTMNEFYNLYQKSTNIRPHKKTGLLGCCIITTLFYLELLSILQKNGHQLYSWISNSIEFMHSPLKFVLFIVLCILFISFFIQAFRQSIESSLIISAVTLFGVLYICISLAHILLVFGSEHGIFYVWLITYSTVASDAMAYFMGKYLGKHKVGFSMSPNKSYEGYIGGLLAQLIMLHLFYGISQYFSNIPEISFLKLTLLGVLMFIATALGDLVESTIKRDLQVKDSGQAIAGHGGFLDLADGMIFTIPSFYYVYLILGNVS